MRAVRTLLIRRRLSELGLAEGEIERVKRPSLRLDALGNLFARGYAVEPPDIQRRFINEFRYFRDSLGFNGDVPKPRAWFVRVHAVGNVQVRASNEKDMGMIVLIDLPKGLLRVRGFLNRRAIEVRLKDGELRYIKERLSEGGRAKFVRVWVDGEDRFNVAITFERDVESVQPSDYALVIDVNSWRYGVWWWLVKGDEVVSRSVVRPDLGYIERLYSEALRVERKFGKLRRLGLNKTPKGRRLKRLSKSLKRKLYAYLRDFVNKRSASSLPKLVGKAPW